MTNICLYCRAPPHDVNFKAPYWGQPGNLDCCAACEHMIDMKPKCTRCMDTGIVEMYEGSIRHGNFYTKCDACGKQANEEYAKLLYYEGKADINV